MGVDLFFVISGFVISLSAFSRFQPGHYAGFARGFAQARLARITPLYFLTGLVFIVFIQPDLVFVPDIWKQVLSHAIFLHSWFLMHQGGINGVNWSISIEMQFYVLIVILVPWLSRASKLLILVGALAIAWSWRAAMFALIDQTGKWATFPLFVYSAELPGMLDEFAAGILLARLIASDRGQRILRSTDVRKYAVPAAAVISVIVTMQIYWNNTTYWNSAWMVIAFKSLLALACVTVLATACLIQNRSVLLACKPFRYLGTISYGIYLWHLPVILALKRVSWVNGPTALPWVIGITLLFASLSWHFFEKPLMQRYAWRSEAS